MSTKFSHSSVNLSSVHRPCVLMFNRMHYLRQQQILLLTLSLHLVKQVCSQWFPSDQHSPFIYINSKQHNDINRGGAWSHSPSSWHQERLSTWECLILAWGRGLRFHQNNQGLSIPDHSAGTRWEWDHSLSTSLEPCTSTTSYRLWAHSDGERAAPQGVAKPLTTAMSFQLFNPHPPPSLTAWEAIRFQPIKLGTGSCPAPCLWARFCTWKAWDQVHPGWAWGMGEIIEPFLSQFFHLPCIPSY